MCTVGVTCVGVLFNGLGIDVGGVRYNIIIIIIIIIIRCEFVRRTMPARRLNLRRRQSLGGDDGAVK